MELEEIDKKIEEELENRNFDIGFLETSLNGSVISWKHWVQQMPILSAAQAARLMAGLDPNLYITLNEHHGHIDPTDAILKATKIQQLAEARGQLKASPVEWLTWAQSLGISVHDGFRLEVLDLPVLQAEEKLKVLDLPVQKAEEKLKVNEQTTQSKKIVKGKSNRNELDPAIDEAIKQAGNMELADVFLKLKDLALSGYLPFTGLVKGRSLCYTNSDDKPDELTKNALGKRLKIRRVNAV